MGKNITIDKIIPLVIHYGKKNIITNFVEQFKFFNQIIILNNNAQDLSFEDKNIKIINNFKNLGIFNAIRKNELEILKLLTPYEYVLILNNDLYNIAFEQFSTNEFKGVLFFPVLEPKDKITIGGKINNLGLMPIEENLNMSDLKNIPFNNLNYDYYYGAAWMIDLQSFKQLITQNFMNNFLFFEELYLKRFTDEKKLDYRVFNRIILKHLKSQASLQQDRGRKKQMKTFFESRKKYLYYCGYNQFEYVFSTMICLSYYILKRKFNNFYVLIKSF